jgi:hypothetical protein
MTHLGQRSRTSFAMFAYVLGATAVIGLGVSAAFAFSSESVPPAAAVTKIGPGYGRMQPIDLGRPEKVINATRYTIPVRVQVAGAKRAPTSIETLIAPSAPPVHIAAVEAPRFAPDLHRIY